MGQHYRFFDSIDGKDERVYSADEFAEYFRQLLTNGVLNGDTNLEVQSNGADMTVSIQPGYAWLEGYLYKVDEEPLPLIVDAADPTLDRIDRIVIRLDKRLDHRYVKAFLLKGDSAAEPIPPSITRDENIYEISLARIQVTAGKSFIDESGIVDERFDEKVCGLVNSLIKVDTQHLINRFEATWGEWFQGIRQDTFVPLKNLQDGFLITPSDTIHAIPDRKLQVEEGWPVSHMAFENTQVDENGDVFIHAFQTGGQLFRYDVETNQSSENLHGSSWIAIPFTVNKETNRVRATMRLKRNSIARLRSIIYEANEDGLPDMKKEVGRYIADSYNNIPGSTFNNASWEIPLTELLVPEKQYIHVFYGNSAEYYINAEYANTPGEINYYRTTNSGTTWTPLERTTFLEIDGIAEEGEVLITYPEKRSFKNHLSISVDMINSINSSYQIDILDNENNLIRENITASQQLLDLNPALYNALKIRIRLMRAGIENPKLRDFLYRWISDLTLTPPSQAMIPSESNLLLAHPINTSAEAENVIGTYQVALGGNYRLTFELRSENANYSAYVNVYAENRTTGYKIGAASYRGTDYRLLSIDIGAVPPNGKIIVALSGHNYSTYSYYKGYVRNIKLYGEPGYLEESIVG